MFPNMPLLIHINEGGVVVGPECIALMLFYLCCSYAVNALSPKLAGKIQASTTVIKLIPLGIMAIVGVIAGLVSGQLTENFVAPPLPSRAARAAFSLQLSAQRRSPTKAGSLQRPSIPS